LLILDEPDAFPYRGDPVLHGIARTSCRGRRIFLTATPDQQLMRRVRKGTLNELILNRRPHGHPLPIPSLFCAPTPFLWMRLIRWIRCRKDHPRMIFVPRIIQAERMGAVLKRIFHSCYVCTSRTPDRDDVIQRFRQESAGLIVATTILERGVTVPGADVCVYEADCQIFDEAGLIQMAGRVGRSFLHPDGDVLFLLKERSELAEKCVNQLRKANVWNDA
ncbi:MAG: helicase, partial [Erysipelotrichia bacterium]|nr:helicase [Erysipelotrichia bacterium]